MTEADEFGPAPLLDRRELLKVMGASLAISSCAVKPAAHLTPGPLTRHATALTRGGLGIPVSVTVRDGRPVKVEGGGLYELAELWRLYDPHRAKAVLRDGKPVTRAQLYDAVAPLVRAAGKKDGGRSVRFLVEPTSSPLLIELRGRVLELLPNARFVSWAPLSSQQRYDGAKLAFGRAFEPLYDFGRAKVVAAFDHDFLSAATGLPAHARAWASQRAHSRLYVVEPAVTVTGVAADHRLAVKGGDVEGVLRGLVAAVAQTRPALQPLAAQAPPADAGRQKWLTALARDLIAAGPAALVTVGDRQSPVVHALAHALCAELGGLSQTVSLVEPALQDLACGPSALAGLADELGQGLVDVLVVTAWNPAFASSGNLDFAALLRRASEAAKTHDDRAVVYAGLYEDETSAQSQWFVPKAHPLEAWGDVRAADGSVLLQQPMVEPLVADALSEVQLLALFAGDLSRPADLLRDLWQARRPDAPFDAWLRAGAVPQSARDVETAAVDLGAIAAVRPGRVSDRLELQLCGDTKVHDGRYASCAWLQELPDPLTKVVWDNAALMSAATAAKLRVGTGARVKLSVGANGLWASRTAAVFVLPGHADDAVTLALGYGRDGVGVDAYGLRHSDLPWFAPVEVTRVEAEGALVTTQPHGDMEGRPLALQVLASEVHEVRERLATLNGEPPVSGWGMAIDLDRCTGCSACVLACVAENNIPVVGKQGVARARDMAWIRVDRYFADDQVAVLPVTCQHCQAAPCEPACPVGATPHTREGINLVQYERCIGTRGCMSHCPYRVRRFNYFDYAPGRLATNPAVVTRGRGVVEKCTFCSHRLEANEARTACQQACPTEAIAFGSLADHGSEVARWHHDVRRYELLHELGTRPRVAYLARVKNPNPELQ